MERVKKINILPFYYSCTVIITDNILESKRKRNNKLLECEITDEPKGLHCDGGILDSYIFLKHDSLSDVIVHESYHCICKLMKDIGAKHEEEIVAYLLGFLTKEIVKFMNKKDKSNVSDNQ